MDKEHISEQFKLLQSEICTALASTDGKGEFSTEKWTRNEGGGGTSRVFQNGNIIEKGGVMFSAVHGPTPHKITQALNLPTGLDFYATGVSIVIHPGSPRVPIIHMNVRYFEMSNGTYWFGGGIDLTPIYVNDEDARFFHRELKTVCDKFNQNFYSAYKQQADDYFYLKHRNETRGVGGIFFDRLDETVTGMSKEKLFEFVLAVGRTFAPVYTSLMKKNSLLPIAEKDRAWQLLRRGRYVEFNLIYDKGTKFGLDTDGRTESILMSMPPLAGWHYNYEPESETSEEAVTLSKLKKGIDWLG